MGCGSATPSLRHQPSCQVLDWRGRLLMIDCGEGAQLGMRRMRLKFSRLTDVFISHLHGDHCLGFPGLLSTLALHDNSGRVTVHTFADGCRLLGEMTDFFCRERSYELVFEPMRPDNELIVDDKSLTVETFPLYHRVECSGFIFREKPKMRHLRGEMAKFYNIPQWQLRSIKEGADFVTADGRVVPNAQLTADADPSISYAYCSDTLYDRRVVESVKGVDVIYHEATYIDADEAKAHQRGHSTASEAARVALDAGAKRLIIGHFSKSYINEEEHLRQARAIFPETYLANEGERFTLL